MPQSVVLWNGSPLTTTYVSSNQLMAHVARLTPPSAGNDSVTVGNGAGGLERGNLTVAPNPVLSLSKKISPTPGRRRRIRTLR